MGLFAYFLPTMQKLKDLQNVRYLKFRAKNYVQKVRFSLIIQ